MIEGPDLEIRPLTSPDDLEQCIDLQRATWGDDFRELVPPAVLMIVQKVGGLSLGAFGARGQLAGFVFGITGVVRGVPVHWSHMLAVTPDRRDHGIGRLLKRAQRDRLLADGITVVRWTFDPLVARNAHLNLARLGAEVIEYVEDMYGDNPMSETDSIIGSDRLVVEWVLDRTESPASPILPDDAPVLDLTDGGDHPFPDAPVVALAVPRDVQVLKRSNPDRAQAWRALTRRAFRHYLAHGYLVRGFLRGRPGTHGAFVLTRAAPR